MSLHRVCEFTECKTILSTYNPGPECYAHSPYQPASHALRSTHKQFTGPEFIDNIPGTYFLTTADVDYWLTGGGSAQTNS